MFFKIFTMNVVVPSFCNLTVTILVTFHKRFQYRLLECFMEGFGNLSKAFINVTESNSWNLIG